MSSLSNNFWPFKIQTFWVFEPALFSDHFLAYGFIWMPDRSSRPLLAIDEGQEKDRKLSDKFIEKLFFFFSFARTFILCQCRLTFWLKQRICHNWMAFYVHPHFFAKWIGKYHIRMASHKYFYDISSFMSKIHIRKCYSIVICKQQLRDNL